MVKHGNLSQSGKVRGMTPKVDKEDKPKKKSGRSAMREKYNRRYKWLYATGKRRGREGVNSQENQRAG